MSNSQPDGDRPDTVSPNTNYTNTSYAKTKIASLDTILANELNKLTFLERESISEEIHGINVDRKYNEESGSIEETPEILTKSFLDLQIELETLCSKNSGVGGSAFAYNRSQEIFGSIPEKGTHLNTKEIRIMFLRCERFDCKKAAIRICAYADLMYELYEDVGLERRARLSDLDDNEMVIIKKGMCQILSGRDRAGRRIYTHFASDCWKLFPVKMRLRIVTYLVMSLLMSDVVSQRRGVVFVMWYHNVKNMDPTDFIARGTVQSRGSSCMPMRIGAVHYCFHSRESSMSEAFVHIISRLAGQIKLHLRIHTGSPIECMYVLESFGITCKQIPLNDSGEELDLTNHNRVLELCAAREENPKLYKHIIECPKYSDILFGRGQIVMNYPGNSMFRNFIKSNLDVFSNVQSKKESTQWTWRAVRTLKNEYGARFLKEERIESEKDITVWVEVSNEVARSKVRIAFRDARKRLAKSAEKETTNNNSNSSEEDNNSYALETMANIKIKRTRDKATPPPALISSLSSSSSSMSMRKNDIITALDNFSRLSAPTQPQPQLLQYYSPAMNFDGLYDNLSILNSSNNNSDSSTSTFLGLDGSSSKRQRMCSPNFFNCM